MTDQLAFHYAEALYSEELSKDALEAILLELNTFADIVEHSVDVTAFWLSSRVPTHVKTGVFVKTFQGQYSDRFLGWLSALIARGRENLLFDVRDCFARMVDLKLNHMKVDVFMASDINFISEELTKIVRKLLNKCKDSFHLGMYDDHTKVDCEIIIDGQVIAGMKLRVQDYHIDCSVHSYLRSWRNAVLLSSSEF